jgi:hypothetical protein
MSWVAEHGCGEISLSNLSLSNLTSFPGIVDSECAHSVQHLFRSRNQDANSKHDSCSTNCSQKGSLVSVRVPEVVIGIPREKCLGIKESKVDPIPKLLSLFSVELDFLQRFQCLYKPTIGKNNVIFEDGNVWSLGFVAFF